MPSCVVQVQWERVMRRLIIMEGDVEVGSTPLKDLFDQVSQGQTKVNFAQVKVRPPCCLYITSARPFLRSAASESA